MNKLNIILNGKKYEGESGETILACAKQQGINIPTLCHDPRLDPYSSCFICVVEVEGLKGLQPACSTLIREGMVVETENEKVRLARKNALDLIVSNHYADCVAPCKMTCPAGVDVQGYISLIEKGMHSEAVALIKEVNPLPAICGRVCVRPCEVACRRNLMDENTGVGIDYLKRFAADHDLASEHKYLPEVAPSSGKKVAVIGAGPGGLSVAWFLQQKGHQVDIYEASPNPGGMLRYGIPPYRLPNELLDAEVDTVKELGTQIFYNRKLGEDLSYQKIKDNYQATVLTIGSQKGTGVGCEGDDAGNVFSGIDFLRNIEMTGQKPDFTGKRVAVIGGGNTAMDCCRTAMRLGADDVSVVYRRTEKEMPANPIEIHESKEEGIKYLFLNNPVKISKDQDGNLATMTLIKMELGEPDASGRRRPIPIQGSEYDLELDFVLAAIGQKTQVGFIDDINKNCDNGELVLNRWGDIDADRNTLQTGIPNIFAAGDGVTGPATLIEAIAQARIAARSCHQYLSGHSIEAETAEFISKKDNFKTQDPSDYQQSFAQQLRNEMPLIPANERRNFDEVELGYSESEAIEETTRCLECGCSEYYSCDLKHLCDEYGADQTNYAGDYQEYAVRFDHPYVEIDNNKCILCSRCVRLCKDVVGAGALGLVNRGFDTYVAPAMGHSLQESSCESCGLCISACPTGALTENKTFKPGPVQLEQDETICHYCSVGCSLELNNLNGFTWSVKGHPGQINTDGNICRFGKFGYAFRNDRTRLTTPLLRDGNNFKAISFKEAAQIIKAKAENSDDKKHLVMAGARMSNEELLMIRRFAQDALHSKISSFHYFNRSDGFAGAAQKNVPFSELSKASHLYLFGTEIHENHAVAGFMVNQASKKNSIPVTYISILESSKLQDKADKIILLDSYYYFIKAVSHYLLSHGKQNGKYLQDHVSEFDAYKNNLLKEDYQQLITLSGLTQTEIERFANAYNLEHHAVIIFEDKALSSAEMIELKNLALITGKLGKTASGLLCLREKNNSQGLIDLDIPNTEADQALLDGTITNLFIFGEDPIGTGLNSEALRKQLDTVDFLVVQDSFMTETAKQANLILPAALPGDHFGSYTNTQRTIQVFEGFQHEQSVPSTVVLLVKLLAEFGLNGLTNEQEAHQDLLKTMAKQRSSDQLKLIETSNEEMNTVVFSNGGDCISKLFETSFDKAFGIQ